MKLGAQLYSVRTFIQTPSDMRNTFEKLRKIGYECVQLSGAGPIEAEELQTISQETGLPIVCTHVPVNRILEDTDALIREHRTFECSVIGLGSIPKEYRTYGDEQVNFLAKLNEAAKRIEAAGMRFAYHNHAFEFEAEADGRPCLYDRLLEEFPNWDFILDTYWVEFAGQSAVEYIERVGANRLANIHFKDLANDEKRSICACGNGVLNFEQIYQACLKQNVKNALVEQDNAVNFEDPIGQMQDSFRHLRPIVH